MSAGSPRAKDNLQCRVVRKFQDGANGHILRDDLVALTGPVAHHYSVELRRVTAFVEVDGQLREMVFLTNNLEWSAQTIADLYPDFRYSGWDEGVSGW